ncbi:MAG: HAD hydrolase-like protein [Erysipelotrichaceae bacterium]|nr:HAD hydrolase-like protein [Erysipelotrichaceae bacterium]
MYQMVVWDCDGTLVNASRMIDCLYEGYHRMYPDRPHKPRSEFVCCYYFTDRETRDYLNIAPSEEEIFHHICFGENSEAMDSVQAFDHIVEVILKLKELGIRQGVNTSRNHLMWNEAIKQLGKEAHEALDTVVTQEEIKHPKPAPDSLEYLMDITGLAAEDILFVGDSINDALCAESVHVPFAYAKWGEVLPQHIPCRYVLQNPLEILQIIKN